MTLYQSAVFSTFPNNRDLDSGLTPRAILLGLLIGCLLCFCNMYYGLQTGWISMMSLQASLVGYAIFKVLSPSLPLSVGENVVLQTIAVATATMPLAGGFVGIIPALSSLTYDDRREGPIYLSLSQLILWGFGLAFFGVFFAIPLRTQVIIKENLPFPSGTATAQIIAVLHRKQDPTLNVDVEQPSDHSDLPWNQKLYTLIQAFLISGSFSIFSLLFPILTNIPIFGSHAASWMWTFSPSPSYIGQGIIMGFHTCFSMLLGAIIGWGFLSPLAKHQGWAPGNVNDWKDGSRGWILWISLVIMICESLISFMILSTQELMSRFKRYQTLSSEFNGFKLFNIKITLFGIFISTTACGLIMKHIFDLPLLDTVVAVFLAGLLSILAVRSLGQTDLNPVSGIGKISQIIAACILPKNIVPNLIFGAITEAGAQQAGDLMQDLKTGYLLNASPENQFWGQLIGSFFSIFISAIAYQLYSSVYSIPSNTFPAPTAQVWLDMARLVNGQSLPPNILPFILCFSLLFSLSTAYLACHPTSKFKSFIPSGVAFAVGIYNPPSFTLARFIGALLSHLYLEHAQSSTMYKQKKIIVILIASGFVLGEGTLSILALFWKSIFSR